MEASSTKAVGNGAKLREAYEFAEEFLRDYGTDWELHNKLCDMLKSALAEPLRNCDVGTVQEQRERFDNFCKKGDLGVYCAYDCPCRQSFDCKLAWAQMPYEANEKGNSK